jgi:CRISPR-associated Csx11 family protein
MTSDPLAYVLDNRNAILLGEVGALIHLINKCSDAFFQHQLFSRDNDPTKNLNLLDDQLVSILNQECIRDHVVIRSKEAETALSPQTFLDYVNRDNRSFIIAILNHCHQRGSSDEKAVPRDRARITRWDDLIIATPFGFKEREITEKNVKNIRNCVSESMISTFNIFAKSTFEFGDFVTLRTNTNNLLHEQFSLTLSDTRLPVNDVTLWAQSSGVAGLYKSALANLAIELTPSMANSSGNTRRSLIWKMQWRVFGVSWQGKDFLRRGIKPADIFKRQEIIDTLRAQIQALLEIDFPIGNLLYYDLDGVWFSFPGCDSELAHELIEQLATLISPLVAVNSDDELSPFFTLSRPRSTLKGLASEIKVRDEALNYPYYSPFLSIEQTSARRVIPLPGPAIHLGGSSDPKSETCPACQFRMKPREENVCSVCRERRRGRQQQWRNERNKTTIWVTEASDTDNRFALITVRFDLDRWLGGDWLTTIFGQTYKDWWKQEEADRIPGLISDVLADDEVKQQLRLDDPVVDWSAIATAGEPSNPDLVHQLTDYALTTTDEAFARRIFNTFVVDPGEAWPENHQSRDTWIHKRWADHNIDDPRLQLDKRLLASGLFTQNASPGRISRIWHEVERILDDWLKALENDVSWASSAQERPTRLAFSTTNVLNQINPQQQYEIRVDGLSPSSLLVVALPKGGEFCTTSRLEGFRFSRELAEGKRETDVGAEAVKQALMRNGIRQWRDIDADDFVNVDTTRVNENSYAEEAYLPFMVLARSPVYCQVLAPATSTVDMLKALSKLIDTRLGRVLGKVPVHVSLAVAKHSFPLYSLIEAGNRMLDEPRFSEGRMLKPWWTPRPDRLNDFFGYYPVREPSNSHQRWFLDDLEPVEADREYWMTPGYFDFAYLSSTADLVDLSYDSGADSGSPYRPSVAYGYLRPRPILFHRLNDMFELWDVLVDRLKLTNSELHHLQSALSTKLDDWASVDAGAVKPVYETFARDVLWRSLDEQWRDLPGETRNRIEEAAYDGLLLETLELFLHVVKLGRTTRA